MMNPTTTESPTATAKVSNVSLGGCSSPPEESPVAKRGGNGDGTASSGAQKREGPAPKYQETKFDIADTKTCKCIDNLKNNRLYQILSILALVVIIIVIALGAALGTKGGDGNEGDVMEALPDLLDNQTDFDGNGIVDEPDLIGFAKLLDNPYHNQTQTVDLPQPAATTFMDVDGDGGTTPRDVAIVLENMYRRDIITNEDLLLIKDFSLFVPDHDLPSKYPGQRHHQLRALNHDNEEADLEKVAVFTSDNHPQRVLEIVDVGGCGVQETTDFRGGLGQPHPNINWENAFPYNPEAIDDRTDWLFWLVSWIGMECMKQDMDCASNNWYKSIPQRCPLAASLFEHYRGGSGTDIVIDYEQALQEDEGIRADVAQVLRRLEAAIVAMFDSTESSFGFATQPDVTFPVSASSSCWIMSIGTHQVWASGSGTYNEGECSLTADVTMDMEYFYNFGSDQYVGLPPAIAGHLQELGWMVPFFVRGSLSRLLTINLECCSDTDCKIGAECFCNKCFDIGGFDEEDEGDGNDPPMEAECSPTKPCPLADYGQEGIPDYEQQCCNGKCIAATYCCPDCVGEVCCAAHGGGTCFPIGTTCCYDRRSYPDSWLHLGPDNTYNLCHQETEDCCGDGSCCGPWQGSRWHCCGHGGVPLTKGYFQGCIDGDNFLCCGKIKGGCPHTDGIDECCGESPDNFCCPKGQQCRYYDNTCHVPSWA